MAARSLLLLLPQCPMDPASGAALVERTTCEMLARAGWHVRAVATTASESSDSGAARRALERAGAFREPITTLSSGREVIGFSCRGVRYQLLDSGAASVNEARANCAADLDEMVAAASAVETPDVLLTYGSSPTEIGRRRRAREAGTRVVFSLHNLGYKSPGAFEAVDLVLTPTRFVSNHYQATHGVSSVPLPMPLVAEDIVAPVREPVFFTFINPSPIKGARFFIHLLQQCNEKWPSLPFLVVESRGSAKMLAEIASTCGVDLRTLGNLHIASNTPNAASIYAVTRVLLVPSLMEAGAKVAAEAMLNGIPVITSDRGGLPETVLDGGFVLPVCDEFKSPGAIRILESWIEAVGKLYLNRSCYAGAAKAAWDRTAPYRDGAVERDRVQVFENLISLSK